MSDQSAAVAAGEDSFLGHLSELRRCLIHTLIAVAVCFMGLWAIRDDVIFFLIRPLKNVISKYNAQIVNLSVMDQVFIHLRTIFVASIIVAMPYILTQIWRFVGPALYSEEKKSARVFFASSLGLFMAGTALCYFFILPLAFDFLMHYSQQYEGVFFGQGASAALQIYLKEHLSLTLNLLFVFGLMFELPLVMIFSARLGIVSAADFKRFRKYSVVASLICSAILTPPDPLTMLGLALPMMVLYEVGIWIVVLQGRAEQDDDTTPA